MSIKGKVIAGVVGVGIIGAGFFGIASLETIEQGHVGVVYNRDGGVEKQTLPQGTHFISPLKKVTEYPVALETVQYEAVPLATKDGKPLNIDINFNYMNDPEAVVDIFNKFKGAKPVVIETSFLLSRAKESALSVTSKYTILEIFQNYEAIRIEIGEKFAKDIKEHGFVVSDFSLGTPTPDEATRVAMQKVVDAQQDLEALKVETQKAQENAKRQKIEAQGIADAQVEKAKGEAEANRLIQSSITPQLLEKMEMEARKAHGWVTVSGANAVVTDK